MAELTLSGVPEDVKHELEREAQEEGLSVDLLLMDVLRLGLERVQEIRAHRKVLSRFVGTMSKEEADAMRASLAEQRRIEEEMWR